MFFWFIIEGNKRVFPRSSIKRLRFAFAALAGLTALALVVGCITFALSHLAQKKFLAETAPLQVNIERLSRVVVGFSSTFRHIQTIGTRRYLERALERYRSQNQQLQTVLLDLREHGLQAQKVRNLDEVVRQLQVHEETYAVILGSKIDAITSLDRLRVEIADEGQVVKDRLKPFTLDSSLWMIDFVQGNGANGGAENRSPLVELNEIQLLSDIGSAVERLLHAAGRRQANNVEQSAEPSNVTLRETIALEFRQLTQLVSKLGDHGARELVARSLPILNEKALGRGGIADQSQLLDSNIEQLEVLNRERAILLTRMTDLMARIVDDARTRFFNDAETAQRRSFFAVTALVIFSTIALAATIWIGWRLINRDIAQRLDHLTTSTVALASGDLDVAIDQSGSDELAGMARATEIFRQNALELRQAEAELADRLLEVESANEKLLDSNNALDQVNAELEESELRYELAIKGSSVGIWDFDAREKTLFWSDRYKEIVGLEGSPDRQDFRAFQDLLHPDDRKRVSANFRSHLDDGAPYNVEYRLRHGHGHYVWIRSRGQAVWDVDGKPMRMVGSIDDITGRKQSEIELANYAKELERSNRELDDFAYIASHDLKEPLRAIFNHASFLLEDYEEKLEEDGQNRLHRMIKLSKRMEKLIADLLYFSRLGRGDQTTEDLDLATMIAGIETDLAETLKSRSARIVISEALPLVSGHPAHINALFQNLISNGVKYNDAAEKVVEIGLAPPTMQDADAPSHCTLFVRDNGIGIDDRFQTDIFRIFKRLNSEKTYGEGTGAGLTFAKKIVENHGGQIWLKSELGNGTTFFFTLKRAS